MRTLKVPLDGGIKEINVRYLDSALNMPPRYMAMGSAELWRGSERLCSLQFNAQGYWVIKK